MVTVSVVSAFYNRAEHVDRSLESLLAQDFDDYEVIVCDDGSTDDTLARLQRHAADPRLTVIGQANAGFVAAMNTMIAQAKGRYIAVHGSGDISLPTRIARQAALLDSDDRIGLVSCGILARGSVYQPEGWGKPGPQPLRATMLRGNIFSHGEVMFRKDLFDRVGGYRPLFRFAQDRDLWLRIGLHADYAVVPEMLYERFNLEGSVSRSADKVILQKRLSEFAALCARTAGPDGRDLIDRHGPQAFLLAERQKDLAHQLWRLGLGFARRGDAGGARALLQAAHSEYPSLRTIMGSWLAKTPETAMVWRLLRR